MITSQLLHMDRSDDRVQETSPLQRRKIRPALATLPKIDLHRHLEGSLRLSTLAEIAHQHGVDLPSWSLEELRPYVQWVGETPDFETFLSKFKLLRRFYSTREAVVRIAYEAAADAADDNVKYLELRFNPVAFSRMQGFSYVDVADWVASGVEAAQHDHDIQVRLIAQIPREEDIDTARRIAEVAVSLQERGFVGLDLAGDEIHYPVGRFAEVFHWAKAQGLHITIHAAEVGPASNVRDAIELLHAERIGHGVHASEDLGVMDLLARHNTTLEMCPTSNVQTGAISKLGQHPLGAYQKIGIRVTINTDDPSVSNTTLTDEYLVALQDIGLSLRALRQTILTSAESAFLPKPERQRLVEWFNQALPLFSAGTLWP
jgi:adenosine deaminase